MTHEVSLVNRVLSDQAADALRERALSLPSVTLSPLALSDAQMIAVGGLSPLEGFMIRADYDEETRVNLCGTQVLVETEQRAKAS
jgi:sulfate adenylyltransferase